MLSRISLQRVLFSLVALLGLAAVMIVPAGAASHRDSPSVTADPTADQNDLYTFVSLNDSGQKVLNVIESYIPLEEAADGPNYYKFADDVRYGLNIENSAHLDANGNPTFTGKPDVSFNLYFHTHYLCTRNTFLTLGIGKGCDDGASPDVGVINSVGDAHQNLQQSYNVLMDDDHTGAVTNLSTGRNLIVPPDNIGRTTALYNQGGNGDNPAQSGAQSTSALDPYTQQSIYTLPNGIKVFAGQRADSFYADLAATFDLLNLRSPGVNSLQGYNVHVIALQIPLSVLASPQCPNGVCVMGMWITSSRRAVTVRPKILAAGHNGDQPVQASPSTTYNDEGVATVSSPYSQGVWRQIGRMGNPLFNEIFVGLDDKDFWNASKPDSDQQFNEYALNPEPVRLLNAVLGLHGATTNRTDLAAIFTPDELRVDTSTDAVPLQPGDPVNMGPQNQCAGSAFSTLSVFGGDTIWSPFQNKCVPSGWPNGRRLTDDVVAITVNAGEPSLNGGFSTGLAATAPTINHVFPFAPTPFNGRNHQHAPQ